MNEKSMRFIIIYALSIFITYFIYEKLGFEITLLLMFAKFLTMYGSKQVEGD